MNYSDLVMSCQRAPYQLFKCVPSVIEAFVFKQLGIIDKDTQQVLMIVTKGFEVASGFHVPSQFDEGM